MGDVRRQHSHECTFERIPVEVETAERKLWLAVYTRKPFYCDTIVRRVTRVYNGAGMLGSAVECCLLQGRGGCSQKCTRRSVVRQPFYSKQVGH